MRTGTLIFIRRLTQTVFFAGLVYIIWSTKYPLNHDLNPSIYFKLDPFVMFVTALAERILLAGLGYSVFVLIVTLIFGRVFCGWFCPLGALQDLLRYAAKIFRKSNKESNPSKGAVVKYIFLAAVAVLAVFGIQTAWVLDPFAIFVRAFSFNIFPWINKIIDGSFIFVLRRMDNPGIVENAYYYLKDNFLALNSPVFPHTLSVFAFFIVLLALVLYKRRFWCRYLCPLGALLAVVAKFSLLKRSGGVCKGMCGLCSNVCRMNAIKKDNSYIKEECILCMDCIDICPQAYSKFTFKKSDVSFTPSPLVGEGRDEGKLGDEVKSIAPSPQSSPARGEEVVAKSGPTSQGITRAQFLVYLAGLSAFIMSSSRLFGLGLRKKASVIRPPAALPEDEFVQRCIRCGNCMKVCPTNVLQPAIVESGLSGIWTPRFDTGIGYCEYKCNLCGKVCPTGAIVPLTQQQKMKTKMGLAEINQDVCLPWSQGTECIVCEEHCPIDTKAIKTIEQKGKNGKLIKCPIVDPSLCVGCAICEFKCPVTPEKAITVNPL